MIETINTAARVIGYFVIGGIGLMFVLNAASYRAFSTASEDAKRVGVEAKEQGLDSGFSALLADGVMDAMDEIAEEMGDDLILEHEPGSAASVDWSMGSGDLTESDVREIRQTLTDAGFYTHPYPRSPDDWANDEWHWSHGNMGIWTDEPIWYIPTEEGREEVNPDLSEWEIEI